MENNVCILESKTIIEQVVAVVIPIITAILTYLTFLHQRRAFKEEQFKSTFYQTQKFHRKLADVLRVNVSLITEGIDVVYRTFLGRQCFLFANNEVQSIIEALSQKRYLGDLKDTDIESINQWQLRQDEYSDNEKERRKAIKMEHIARNDCKYKFYIKTYHISENDYNKAKTLSNKGEYAFRIFLNERNICYEHYIRSLQEILEFVRMDIPKKLKTRTFLRYIASQMAKEELWFIKQYSHIDSSFHKCYTDSGMDKVVEEQLTK